MIAVAARSGRRSCSSDAAVGAPADAGRRPAPRAARSGRSPRWACVWVAVRRARRAGRPRRAGRLDAAPPALAVRPGATRCAPASRTSSTFAAASPRPTRSAITPAPDLLTGLRGKDVDRRVRRELRPGRRPGLGVLAPGRRRARRRHRARCTRPASRPQSAFLTSPTFGGISWLAHSTLQSGLWIDNQQRYDELVASDRFTLSDAFKRAGWRTVGDVPSNDRDWPEGTSFYHYDQIYDARNVGYAGPKFSYATMPDQYILPAFQRLELAKPDHAPVMAEIDLVSSHTPWTPLPHMVAVEPGRRRLGLRRHARAGPSRRTQVWRNPDQGPGRVRPVDPVLAAAR